MIQSYFNSLSLPPEIKFLLLFGSRARGDEREGSDWDFGYVAEPGYDSAPFYNDLVLFLKTEKIDLVNLSTAGALIRFRAAKEGVVLKENSEGEYNKFVLQAVHFWCDAGPLIQREYKALLERY